MGENMKIEFIFAWFDFWIGIFYDRKSRIIYFLPIPMIGIKIILKNPKIQTISLTSGGDIKKGSMVYVDKDNNAYIYEEDVRTVEDKIDGYCPRCGCSNYRYTENLNKCEWRHKSHKDDTIRDYEEAKEIFKRWDK